MVLIGLLGHTVFPHAFPQLTRLICGLSPQDPDFRTRYKAHLEGLIGHLKAVVEEI